MINPLLSKLREKDKKGIFTRTQTAISYNTGFPTFDFRNGYRVQARDLNEKLIAEYPSTGLVGGSFITVIGKSGTAKTTWCIQSAFNIVRQFDSGMVLHYDLEQALSYTRIKDVTKASQIELDQKYILKQEKMYIEDIFDSIQEIYKMKMENKKEFSYDTGLVDEFGNKITSLVPTCIILDSIPSMYSMDSKTDEMAGQTEAMRTAKALKQFYLKLLPIVKEGNLIIMTINHINTKIEVSAFSKTQPQVMYLKMDEALPGGSAPIYYANTLIKFVTSDKKNSEDDGYDGFRVRAELIKSRTNKGGKFAMMNYDQTNGFSTSLTLYEFAEDNKLVEGRNPYRYFKGLPELKFSSKKIRELWAENPEFRKALLDTVEPALSMMLDKDLDEQTPDVNEMTKVFDV